MQRRSTRTRSAASTDPVKALDQGPKKKVAKDEKAQKEKAKSSAKKVQKKDPSPAKSASPPKKQLAKPQNVKKMIMKGKAPVDEQFPQKEKYHVLQDGGQIYDCTLNQSNVSQNNNKYYRLQVLESDATPLVYVAWFRWGRVGYAGQVALNNCGQNKQAAINNFNSKKRDKIKSYKQIEISYNQGPKEEDEKKKKEQMDESKLKAPVKDLLNLIFDMKMINKQMMQIGYDPAKLPLGKLSQKSIKIGYELLDKISTEIQGSKRSDKLAQLSSQFYSYIPHNFGFASMSLFTIKDKKTVKEKLQMLKSIEDIQVATRLMQSPDTSSSNLFDQNYKKLNTQIEPLDCHSDQFKILQEYVTNTHAATHNNYGLKILDIFKLQREGEALKYKSDIGNKMLLWHGSRLTNFVGIISQGLRIAPPQAPVTGYMFGKGIYFADMVSKSANYCFTSKSNNVGLMLLCQVALGKCNPKYQADYYANNMPQDCKSTIGRGRTAPDEHGFKKIGDVIVPCGKSKAMSLPQPTALLYNEFIVYDVSQVRMKYLLKLQFQYR